MCHHGHDQAGIWGGTCQVRTDGEDLCRRTNVAGVALGCPSGHFAAAAAAAAAAASGFLGVGSTSAGFCEGSRWDKINPCRVEGHTVKFAMLELYAMCRRMRRRSIRTLVTQPAQVCQGEYDLTEDKIQKQIEKKKKIELAGWLGVCLPRLWPASLTAYLPACAGPWDCHEVGWIECSSVGPWVQVFLLVSTIFFLFPFSGTAAVMRCL